MSTSGKRSFQELADKLISRYRPDVRVSRMYGITVLMSHGQPFAGLNRDDMVFRLGSADYARALKFKGAQAFEAGGRSQGVAWVQVPVVHVGHWRRLAEAAYFDVSRLSTS